VLRTISERNDKDKLTRPSAEDNEEDLIALGKDVIKVTAILPLDDTEKHLPIYIHKSREVKDLYSKAEAWLTENYNFNSDRQDFKLMYKNQIVKKTLTLKEADITYHTKIYVLVEDLDDGTGYKPPAQERRSASPPLKQAAQSETINTSYALELLAPKERLPAPPKAGYTSTPDVSDLARMTLR